MDVGGVRPESHELVSMPGTYQSRAIHGACPCHATVPTSALPVPRYRASSSARSRGMMAALLVSRGSTITTGLGSRSSEILRPWLTTLPTVQNVWWLALASVPLLRRSTQRY